MQGSMLVQADWVLIGMLDVLASMLARAVRLFIGLFGSEGLDC